MEMKLEELKLVFGICIFITSLHLAMADLPAVFIFGDSTADVGTNNYLPGCNATANNPFYGIDYPYSKPTGRFSNGYNTADLIVKLLGDYKESPPPFLALEKDKANFKKTILRGVNFASGGSGILDRTGSIPFNVVVPLGNQIEQFARVRKNIIDVLGAAKGEQLLSNSLYILSAGSNDFFDYMRFYNNISAPALVADLCNTYAKHLENLYNLGARKLGIVGVPAIGCIPALRAKFGGSCFEDLNNLSQAFYTSIQTVMEQFSSAFQGVKYSLGNTYLMTMNIIDNASVSRFKNVKEACCGTGKYNGEDKCNATANLCLNHDEYLFWDWFHPTQAASKLAALTLLYAEGPEFVTPMNFSQLASINV